MTTVAVAGGGVAQQHAGATATAPDAGQFMPLPTTRVVDTTSASGVHDDATNTTHTGPLLKDQYMNYDFLGHGGVPTSGVLAVVLHVTTLNGSNGTNPWDGYVWSYPATSGLAAPNTDNDPRPGSADTVVNNGQQAHADNTVIVELGDDGQVTFTNGSVADVYSSSVDLYVDVEGYVTDGSGSDGAGGTYAPLTPYRELNNWALSSAASHWNKVVGTGAAGGIDVPSSPSQVAAVAINLSASGSSSNCSVAATPADAADPAAAQKVHTYKGAPADQLVITALSPSGGIYLSTDCSSVSVSVDLEGYYLPASSGGSGDVYVPVDPDRIIDTRSGLGVAGTLAANSDVWGSASIPITGVGEVPASNVAAVALSFQTLGTQPYPTSTGSGHGYVTAWTKGQTQPAAVQTVGADVSVNESSLAFIQPSNPGGAIDLYNSSGETTDLTVDVEGYFEVPAAPGAPEDVASTPVRNGSTTVSWDPPVSDGGAGITSYQVKQGGSVVGSTGSTSLTVTGLSDAQEYGFTVTATNAIGTGPSAASGVAAFPPTPLKPAADEQVFTGTVTQDGSTIAVSAAPEWSASDIAAIVTIECSGAAAGQVSVQTPGYAVAPASDSCDYDSGTTGVSTQTLSLPASGTYRISSTASATVSVWLRALIGPAGSDGYVPAASDPLVDTGAGNPSSAIPAGASITVALPSADLPSSDYAGLVLNLAGSSSDSGVISVSGAASGNVPALAIGPTASSAQTTMVTNSTSLTVTNSGTAPAQLTMTVAGYLSSAYADQSADEDPDLYAPIPALAEFDTTQAGGVSLAAGASATYALDSADSIDPDTAELSLLVQHASTAGSLSVGDSVEGADATVQYGAGSTNEHLEVATDDGDAVSVTNNGPGPIDLTGTVQGYWVSSPQDADTNSDLQPSDLSDLDAEATSEAAAVQSSRQSTAPDRSMDGWAGAAKGQKCTTGAKYVCIEALPPGDAERPDSASVEQMVSDGLSTQGAAVDQHGDDAEANDGDVGGTLSVAGYDAPMTASADAVQATPERGGDGSVSYAPNNDFVSSASSASIASLPNACWKSTANGGIAIFSRWSSCSVDTWRVKLFSNDNGEVTQDGKIDFALAQVLHAHRKHRSFTDTLILWAFGETGVADEPGTCEFGTLGYFADLNSGTVTTPDQNQIELGPLGAGCLPIDSATLHLTDYGANGNGRGTSYPAFFMTAAFSTVEYGLSAFDATGNPSEVRCDSASYLPGTAGCVQYFAIPEVSFSERTSGPYPDAASFYGTAQNEFLNGLGAPSSGTPLYRWKGTKKERRQARNFACPQSYPRHGLSCDEYPFNSTYENWLWQSHDGVSHPCCRARVPLAENRLAGSHLSKFYSDERLMDYDGFYVKITR